MKVDETFDAPPFEAFERKMVTVHGSPSRKRVGSLGTNCSANTIGGPNIAGHKSDWSTSSVRPQCGNDAQSPLRATPLRLSQSSVPVPDLTGNGSIKLNARVSLRDRGTALRSSNSDIAIRPGSTVAKSPVNHIPAGDFVSKGPFCMGKMTSALFIDKDGSRH